MRIWDVSPGYLNRQSLLGEHRELHGMVSIIRHGKKGYSFHPETLRWCQFGWALKMRHQQLSCEMALRGYRDNTPVDLRRARGRWPDHYIDDPANQLKLLGSKYQGKEPGRIPLPKSRQQLWQHHKYSVMARSIPVYRDIGQKVARQQITTDELADLLTKILRQRPSSGGIRNALLHMWGYLSDQGKQMEGISPDRASPKTLLKAIQSQVGRENITYLYQSTALSDLMVWL